MNGYEHYKALGRMLTIAFAAWGNDVNFERVQAVIPVKGKPFWIDNNTFKINTIHGNSEIASITANEIASPLEELDENLEKTLLENITKAINNIKKIMRMEVDKNPVSILDDDVCFELLNSIRNPYGNKDSKALFRIVADEFFDNAQELVPVLNGEQTRLIDKGLLATAMNNAKIIFKLPEKYMDNEDLAYAFDDGFVSVAEDEFVRNNMIERALKATRKTAGILFIDPMILEAYERMCEDKGIETCSTNLYRDDDELDDGGYDKY